MNELSEFKELVLMPGVGEGRKDLNDNCWVILSRLTCSHIFSKFESIDFCDVRLWHFESFGLAR